MSLDKKAELTGKDVNYYLVDVKDPKRLAPYTAECEDIIEALGMTFSEGCAFKAIWRSCAARTLGTLKAGQSEDGIYDAEKLQYYGGRILAVRKRIADKSKLTKDQTAISKNHDKFAPIFKELFSSIRLNAGCTIPEVCNGQSVCAKPDECVGKVLCAHRFRSKECGYFAEYPHTCDKRFNTCKTLLNEANFVTTKS